MKSVRYSRRRYQELLREKESLRKQNTQCAQLAIIDKEIEEVEGSIAESIKISKNFHAEFLRLSDEVEKKRNFELLPKGNTWKIKFKKNRMKPTNLKRLCRYSKRKEERLCDGQT